MTPDLPTLTSLRDRVRKLTGPDREVDGLLDQATGLPVEFAPLSGPWVKYPDGYKPAYGYTASVDACIALVERVLPGKWWELLCDALVDQALGERDAEPSRLPVFFLDAILSALIAEEGQ